ncbi:MAG: hypothetical protein R3C99_21035 [Pirellulaceae bacterium]
MARKATTGHPFKPAAREWNTLVDAGALETGELTRLDVDPPELSQTKSQVKNETGYALPPFHPRAWRTVEDARRRLCPSVQATDRVPSA